MMEDQWLYWAIYIVWIVSMLLMPDRWANAFTAALSFAIFVTFGAWWMLPFGLWSGYASVYWFGKSRSALQS